MKLSDSMVPHTSISASKAIALHCGLRRKLLY